MASNKNIAALIQSLKSDRETDSRIIDILTALNDRDNELESLITKAALPKAEKTKLIPVNYLATDFTGLAPLTLAVTLAQLESFTYSVQDDMMEMTVRIVDATLGGVAGNEIRINIPGGFAVAGNPNRPDQFFGTGDVTDGGGAVSALVIASALTPTVIRVLKVGLANYVLGPVTIRIQIRFGVNNALYKSA